MDGLADWGILTGIIATIVGGVAWLLNMQIQNSTNEAVGKASADAAEAVTLARKELDAAIATLRHDFYAVLRDLDNDVQNFKVKVAETYAALSTMANMERRIIEEKHNIEARLKEEMHASEGRLTARMSSFEEKLDRLLSGGRGGMQT